MTGKKEMVRVPGASHLFEVVAVPVAAPDALAAIQAEADEVTCLMAPDSFQSVGKWYEQFGQVSDDEVRDIISLQEPAMPAG